MFWSQSERAILCFSGRKGRGLSTFWRKEACASQTALHQRSSMLANSQQIESWLLNNFPCIVTFRQVGNVFVNACFRAATAESVYWTQTLRSHDFTVHVEEGGENSENLAHKSAVNRNGRLTLNREGLVIFSYGKQGLLIYLKWFLLIPHNLFWWIDSICFNHKNSCITWAYSSCKS
jgi:ribosomal protein S9